MPFQPDQPNSSSSSGFVPDPPPPSTARQVMDDATGPYIGIAKGVGRSVAGADAAYRRGAQALTGLLPDEIQAWLRQAPASVQDALGLSAQDPAVGAALEPQGLAQKLGYYGERGVENAIAYTNPLRGAIEGGLESGGDPKGIALGAGAGAAGYVAGRAIPAVGRGIATVIRNNPETVSGVADAVGVVHPPLAHGIRLAQRAVRVADRFAPAATDDAVAPAVAREVPTSAPIASSAPTNPFESILPPEQVPQTGNPYQAMNRISKANKMGLFLHNSGRGLTPEQVAAMTDADWKLAEAGAGVKPLSAASRKVAMQWHQRYENYAQFQRARQAAPPIASVTPPEGLQ
jgi:hypothetical protein